MKIKISFKKQEFKKFIVLFFVLAFVVATIYPQFANAMTSLSDTMSRLKIDEETNHLIEFTIADDIDASGEDFVVTLEDFTNSTGTADYTDVDLEDDSADLTLAATASATEWGVDFQDVAGDTEITFTHPTSAPVEDIASGSVVTIEIGLNATSGDQQLENPSVAATYIIDINVNSGGDTGKIAVAIITDDEVIINTTINPYITFVLTTNTVTLTQAGSEPDYTATGYNEGAANTLAASTNADSGYNISYEGSTLTSGSNTIDAMAAQAASSTGTEQFGINLKNNATPNTGSDASGGSGAAESDYNTADQYTFIADTTTALASASIPSVTTTFEVTYIVNVSQTTEAGAYTTTVTYICTGNF